MPEEVFRVLTSMYFLHFSQALLMKRSILCMVHLSELIFTDFLGQI